MISFVAIGASGSGKSTIGNFFLGGAPKGHFKTSSGVDSCTHEATTKTNSEGRSYTDTPGIPDTKPVNTRAFYNECIDALKKEHSAIIFVFKYGRIDPEKLRTSKLLFREMNKANCMKFLIINDHNNYGFNDPPDQSEYRRLADEIKSYTEVDFLLVFDVTSPNAMKERVEFLYDVAKQVPKPQSSPNLKNFDELSKWVDSLKNDADFLREAIVEHDAAIERAKKNKDYLKDSPFIYDCLGRPVQSFILGGSAFLLGSAIFVPLRSEIQLGLKEQDDIMSRRQDNRIRDEKVLEKAIVDLKEAADSFEELRQAVEA